MPPLDDWLSAAEAGRLAGMRFEKRRADWRLGRWTAKLAATRYLGMPCELDFLRDVEVGAEASGAPVVSIGGRPAPVSISLSHREGVAICAIAAPRVELGCDLEVIEPRSSRFVADYFTPVERSFLEQAPAGERTERVALLWSAKESALKALRVGLRVDPRDAAVLLPAAVGERAAACADCWRPLRVACQERTFDGWWMAAGRFVRTLAAAPSPGVPSRLTVRPPAGMLAVRG